LAMRAAHIVGFDNYSKHGFEVGGTVEGWAFCAHNAYKNAYSTFWSLHWFSHVFYEWLHPLWDWTQETLYVSMDTIIYIWLILLSSHQVISHSSQYAFLSLMLLPFLYPLCIFGPSLRSVVGL
jgi:hypothetical protein